MICLLIPIIWALLAGVLAQSPYRDTAQIAVMSMGGVLLLAIPLFPAIWQRKNCVAATFHLTMSRSMITVYAVMTLFFAALVPVCTTYERHYAHIDRLMVPMIQQDNIAFNMVEGRLVFMLRDGVREGATKLGIPWR